MKRFLYFVFCVLTTVTGLALGRYVWAVPAADAPVIGSSGAKRTLSTHPGSFAKALAAVHNGPRRAALMLAMAARGERAGLTALIDACRDDRAALQFLASIWLRTDPAAFLRSMTASKALRGAALSKNYPVLTDFVKQWADIDFDGAWRNTEKLNSICRRALLHELAGKRMDADPRAGLEFALNHPEFAPGFGHAEKAYGPELLPLIQKLPDSSDKMRMLRDAITGLPFSEAMSTITGTGLAERFATTRALETAMDKSLDEVIAWHGQSSGNARSTAAAMIGDRLVTKDPAAAIRWAQANLSGSGRTETIRQAAEALQKTDPAAAAAAKRLLPENAALGITAH